MFETILALRFILKKRVYIFAEPRIKKDVDKQTEARQFKYQALLPSKKRPPTKKAFLTREFRACLYVAHDALQESKASRKCSHVRGLKMLGKWLNSRVDRRVLKAIENRIGSEWFNILNDTNSYSGLSISDLTKALSHNLYRFYVSIYAMQCHVTHAGDAIRNVKSTTDDGPMIALWMGQSQHVSRVLRVAIGLFMAGMETLHGEIGFGQSHGIIMSSFQKEFRAILREEATRD